MKKMIAVAMMCMTMLGTTLTSSAQGVVTFSSLSQADFNSYIDDAAWIALVNTTGQAGFAYPNNTGMAYLGGAATLTSVLITNGGGNVGMTTTITSGQFGSTGDSVSSSVSSSGTIYALAIGVLSPYQLQGRTASISDLYVVGDVTSYQSVVANSSGSGFGGMLCTFGSGTTSFNTAFTLHTGMDSDSQIYIMGLISPIPEPTVFALGLLGLSSLPVWRRKK